MYRQYATIQQYKFIKSHIHHIPKDAPSFAEALKFSDIPVLILAIDSVPGYKDLFQAAHEWVCHIAYVRLSPKPTILFLIKHDGHSDEEEGVQVTKPAAEGTDEPELKQKQAPSKDTVPDDEDKPDLSDKIHNLFEGLSDKLEFLHQIMH